MTRVNIIPFINYTICNEKYYVINVTEELQNNQTQDPDYSFIYFHIFWYILEWRQRNNYTNVY